ncbi:REP-associated tyrosine transposase [Cognatishimia activa]|uniref:REP-associated tyrosine transposase n=1 Tax=Cognatishimia activa TaxID=1715691 RepID=UPI003D78B94F
MPNYIRPKIPGATVFLTVNLAHREQTLLTDHFDALSSITLSTLKSRPVTIHQWVVLPNHMHCLWTLPSNDHDFYTRVASIKAQFTMTIRRAGFSPPPNLPIVTSGRYAGLKPGLRVNKREQGIWQRRFWEHHIRDQNDFDACAEYCWHNPVKHGLTNKPETWPFRIT